MMKALPNLAVLVLVVMLGACASHDPQRSAGEYVDDAAVTAKVKAALLKDDDVDGLDVKVETFRGVVQLSGFVESREQIRRAVAIARSVPGVKSIENDIRLKQDP